MSPSLLWTLTCVILGGSSLISHCYILPAVRLGRSFRHLHCKGPYPQRYTVKSPLDCEIRSVRCIGSNGLDRRFFHIVIDHGGRYNYSAGQYCGVLPPGICSRTNRTHVPRSYSLAPVLREDDVDPSNCFSLGIRAPIVSASDHAKFRDICVCSQFLSGASPGTAVRITGPFGKFMLSECDLSGDRNLLLIATGTGIVPYMGFLDILLRSHRLGTSGCKMLLLFGIQSPDTYLYREQLAEYVLHFGGRFEVLECYSRYGSVSERGYVQDVLLRERSLVDSVCNFGGRPCSIFICGGKSMEKGVLSSLREVFSQHPHLDTLMSNVKIEVYE